jgi:hypothetical protein
VTIVEIYRQGDKEMARLTPCWSRSRGLAASRPEYVQLATVMSSQHTETDPVPTLPYAIPVVPSSGGLHVPATKIQEIVRMEVLL